MAVLMLQGWTSVPLQAAAGLLLWGQSRGLAHPCESLTSVRLMLMGMPVGLDAHQQGRGPERRSQ